MLKSIIRRPVVIPPMKPLALIFDVNRTILIGSAIDIGLTLRG